MTDYIADINSYKIGGDEFNSYYYMLPAPILISSGALASTTAITVNLEDIIPDDGYDYEVFLGADGYLEWSGHWASFNACAGIKTYDSNLQSITTLFFQEDARTSARYYGSASRWIRISSNDRNVTIFNFGTASYTYTFYLYGLRRLTENVTQNCISNIDITIYNPDGTNWTQATQDTNLGSNSWRALTYGDKKFVALGSQGYISTSTDGETWTTAVQNTNLGSNTWRALAYDGTKFVALGYYGYISTSTDGETWTTAVQNTNLSSAVWNGLVYDGTKFVALGLSGYISTSTDGVTWTQATQNAELYTNYWQSLAYNGTKFVALGRYGDISTSTDGTTWTTAIQNINLGNNNWTTLTYDGVRFIALSSKPTGDTGSYISYSTNGTTWTQAIQNENLKNGNWNGLVHNNRRTVALDISGMIANSPDTALTQQIPIGGNNFDGQPVQSQLVLERDFTMAVSNVRVYDLSNYLPNDGYDYMVDFGAYGRTATSSAGYYHWYIGSGTLTASEIKDKAYLMMASEYHSTSTYCCSNNISIPIFATDKNVTFAVTDNSKTSGGCSLYTLGYRRIGKNMNEYNYVPAEYLTYSSNSTVTLGIKYEDYLKIQKINTTGKYECDFYNLSSTPTVMSNSNLMVYTDAQEAQTAISNWSSNTADFPPNEHTLITDLTSLDEVAVYYRVANNSFIQQGIIKYGNDTLGNNPQIIEIGEL